MSDILDLDFNMLKALHALLLTHNVSEAARRTDVTQPAMSATLRRLRAHFDDPLLVRRGNRMLPTPLALRLVEPVGNAVQAVALALGAPRLDGAPRLERVSIATTDDVVVLLAAKLVKRLSEETGAAKVSFKPLDPGYNLTELELGQVDAVITVDWTAPPQLKRRRLFVDEFVCVVRRNSALGRGKLTPNAFAAARHLLVAPLGGESGPVDAALSDLGLSREVAVVVPSFTLVPQLLRDHPELVCTMPEKIARSMLSARTVAWRQPPVSLPKVRYDLFWHTRVQPDPAHRWLRQVIVGVAKDV